MQGVVVTWWTKPLVCRHAETEWVRLVLNTTTLNQSSIYLVDADVSILTA